MILAETERWKPDLTGQQFGKLTVVDRFDSVRYVCRCECGEHRRICAGNLRDGRTKSCGRHARSAPPRVRPHFVWTIGGKREAFEVARRLRVITGEKTKVVARGKYGFSVRRNNGTGWVTG